MDTKHAPTRSYDTLDQWIARAAIPFSLDSPAAFNAAVDRLVGSLGHSLQLLGFGEALHGGEEILTLRNRLFRRLVTAHGYSAIALESSFPRGRVLNEYVAGRGPAAYEDVQEAGFSHGFGRLQANRELIAWMRQYNADPAHSPKLHFYGFDSPTEMSGSDSPHHVLHFVLDYLGAIDRAGAGAYRERIEPLLGAVEPWENPAAMMDPAQSIGLSPKANALRVQTEDLISELQVRRPEFIAKSGKDPYLEAMQYAGVARQLLTYHAALARPSADRVARLLGIRDAMMAEILAGIVARERGRGKVLAFAHNSHLQRSHVEWQLGPRLNVWWPAGAHLDALFGPRYAVVGSAVGVSDANGIGPPEAGTLEARLAATPGPVRFIPTQKGAGLPAAEIEALPVRSTTGRNSSYLRPLDAHSFTDFDWLAVLDSTGYAAGGPPLPQRDDL